MSQEDWVIIMPAIAGYFVWPVYRLIAGSKKSTTGSILFVIFWVDLFLSVFLVLDMRDLSRRHVTDARDTIMVIIFVALLSFLISVLTVSVSILFGIIKKYSLKRL
jgi:hypothetical protein